MIATVFSAAIREDSGAGLHHQEHGPGQRQLAHQVREATARQEGHRRRWVQDPVLGPYGIFSGSTGIQ